MAVNDDAIIQEETQVQMEATPADGWHPDLNQDEAIKAQKEFIESEINTNCPLVTAPVSLDLLAVEYSEDDSVYQTKLANLQSSHTHMRKTRPDGNCFFRAFGFAYFESLLKDEEELKRLSSTLEKFKNDLIELKFPAMTMEEFYDTFAAVVESISSGETRTPEQLLEIFNDQGRSDYLVVFLRLLTSGHLKANSDFFENFIEGYATVSDFCASEVEPMYKESDHIHIIALTSAIGVAVDVCYLDRGGVGEKVSIHTFPEDGTARLRLLYRPGHYDILYPKAQPQPTPGAQITSSNGESTARIDS